MNNPTKINTLFDLYIDYCQYQKRLRPSTLKTYTEVFNNFKNTLPEIQETQDLRPQVMTLFNKRLTERIERNGRSVKDSTIYTYYQKLVGFFKWLELENHIPSGSLTRKIYKPPQPRYEDDKALSQLEIAQIISAITLNTIARPFLAKRDLLIVQLLIYTGIRKGELLGLSVGDVDLHTNRLYINHSTSKSKKSRYIPIHFLLANHLRVYLKALEQRNSRCGYLLISSKKDKPLSEHGLKHLVEKYNRLSGVSFHLHQFRHSFACALAKQRADIISIMNLLGHSSTKMTERYLRSLKTEDARKYVEQLVI